MVRLTARVSKVTALASALRHLATRLCLATALRLAIHAAGEGERSSWVNPLPVGKGAGGEVKKGQGTRGRLEQLLQTACAVADGLGMNAHTVEQGEEQVRHRGSVRVVQMTPRFDRARALAGQQDRQVVMVVAVAIADARAVDDHRIIEQRTLALADGLHLFQQVGQLGDMEAVDLADLVLFLLVPAMMGKVVMSLR